MWRLSDILLRKKAKMTNTILPHSDYITADTFPEQITELIGTTVNVKYANEYTCNIKTALEKPASRKVGDETISLRPEDDHQFLEPRELNGPDFIDARDVWDIDVTILRADKVEPYVFIGISWNFDIVVISSTRENEMMHYTFLDEVTVYPMQYNEFFGLNIITHYMNDEFVNDTRYDAKLLRLDKTEPNNAVIMEYIDDDTVRFVLGDEVTAIDNEPFDPENYITTQMIPEYRAGLLEGKNLYGAI